MADGIHVEVAIAEPPACQVAPHAGGEAIVTSVTKSQHPADGGVLVEEFTLKTGPTGIQLDGGTTVRNDEVQRLFTAGTKEILRFERETPQHCVCERIEAMGCPVRGVHAADGGLHVRFIAPDHETLQSVLEELADVYDEMSVTRLLHSADATETDRLAIVDVAALTERQREVMRVAHEMGYFEHPKDASAQAVADRLDISRSTFTEHLAAAQRNLLAELLER